MEIIPMPLDSEPMFFVQRNALSEDDFLALLKRGPGSIISMPVVPQREWIQCIGPEEPLDRIAGMISDDDFDAHGFAWKLTPDA